MIGQPTRQTNLISEAFAAPAIHMPVVIRVSGSCIDLSLGFDVKVTEQDPAGDPGEPPRKRSRT